MVRGGSCEDIEMTPLRKLRQRKGWEVKGDWHGGTSSNPTMWELDSGGTEFKNNMPYKGSLRPMNKQTTKMLWEEGRLGFSY